MSIVTLKHSILLDTISGALQVYVTYGCQLSFVCKLNIDLLLLVAVIEVFYHSINLPHEIYQNPSC